MNNILLIDDRLDFAEGLIREAKAKDVIVLHKKSFAGLKDVMLQYSHKLAAVILDIKCLLTDDQAKEDSSFIGSAMTYLDQTYPRFPRLILTGDDKEFEKFRSYFLNEKVFLKTPQGIESMFNELGSLIANSETLKLKRDNLDVFNLFEEGRLSSSAEVQLINILKRTEERSFTNFKGILADIRSLQEVVYKTINKKNKEVVPDKLFKSNGMVKFGDLMNHLNGYPNKEYKPTKTVYQNNSVYNLANSLYWICGEYIHEETERKYLISNYTIKSLTNNLMELLLWSRLYI